MPSVAEILFYMRGLWRLFKGDPSAGRYLDFTERGLKRSFWSMALSMPFMMMTTMFTLAEQQHLAFAADIRTVIRTALVEGLSWVVPLVVFGVICMIAALPKSFPRLVIASNWMSLPVNVIAAIAIALIASDLGILSEIVLLFLQVIVLGAFIFEIRIVYVLMENRLMPTAAAIVSASIIALLISDIGMRYIGGL